MEVSNMKNANPEHYKSLALIASAEDAVNKNDVTGAKQYLKGVMKWCGCQY